MKIKDKAFSIFIPHKEILERVKVLAKAINQDYAGQDPLFIAVLNGAFMFASDLMKEIDIPCELSFVKFSSYKSTSSTGKVNELVGLKEALSGRPVVVIEDIVDSGNTIAHIGEVLKNRRVGSYAVATLLYKPEALQREVNLQYIGFSIPKTFVVGYGLDYDGYGRNLKDIYQLSEDPIS